jgi:hypothetical protein
MLPEWTFGLLLGFHIDQRRGSCVGFTLQPEGPLGQRSLSLLKSV